MERLSKNKDYLSIVVPAYRAEKSIVESLSQIRLAADGINYKYEIICVVDGKVDKTFEVASKYAKKHSRTIHVYGYKNNLGKGHAVRYGMSKCRGNIVGFIDAGLDINPSGLQMLLMHFKWYRADAIIGSKRHPASYVEYPWQRKIMSYGYQYIVKVLFGLNIKDTQVGMKFFRKSLVDDTLDRLLVKAFAFDVELLAVANSLGYTRIFEAPVELKMDFGASTIATKGFVKTSLKMFWDTLAVYYRLKILHYYSSTNKANWIHSGYRE